MAKRKTIKKKERKIQAIVGFASEELEFVDRKIDNSVEHRVSRSAIIRHLIHKAMVDPSLLD